LIEDHVVAHEKIQLAVAIVIDPRAAAAEMNPGTNEARLPGHICECAVPVVVKQQIAAPTGDEEIVEAVVVVIAHRYAKGPHAAAQPCMFGYVRERAVAV